MGAGPGESGGGRGCSGGWGVIRHQDLDNLAIIIFAPRGSGVIRHQDLDNLAIIIFAPGGSQLASVSL